LVDVETFEATQRRISVLEGLAIGEQAHRNGQHTSHTAARKRLARWLG
jgi:hypothetical protein